MQQGIPGKKYRFTDTELKPLAEGLGTCFASDMITVDGFKVGFLYRQHPDNDGDSGWRFLTGFENDDYMNVASNFGLFDVNVIANCDPEIIQFLSSPPESAFGRDPAIGNQFAKVDDFDAAD